MGVVGSAKGGKERATVGAGMEGKAKGWVGCEEFRTVGGRGGGSR